jgi:uncharacterized membrane protein
MFAKLYLTALFTFLGIDMIWLLGIAKSFYVKHLGSLMRTEINWVSALLFYLLFIVGLVVFVIEPALEKRSLAHAFLYGALFGLITYATYDLTNLATLESWPLVVTVVDLAWGMVIASLVSSITYLLAVIFKY